MLKTEYNGKKLNFIYKKTTVSTNTDAKEMALDGTVIIADTQTGGRGRQGREFVSKEGGVYASIYLDAKSDFNPLNLTAVAAVAVSKALDKMTDKNTLIKWVNDIYLDGKKVCGILAEGVFEGNRAKGFVLGIGVNLVKNYDFSDELSKKAGFVFEYGDYKTLREVFLNDFLSTLFGLLKKPLKDEISNYYNKKNYLSGRTVTFYDGDTVNCGKVLKIDSDIALVVQTQNGERRLTFGEVDIKPD